MQIVFVMLIFVAFALARPKAALISLVRNEELEGIMQSMRQLEHHWNHAYAYPWIFFSETPFSPEFKTATSALASGKTYYELIPVAHWPHPHPSWIDKERYHDSLTYLHAIGVGKGHLLSYRNMCRWNSGFFYRHPFLVANAFEYYWRVEPDVHFFCDVEYDVFQFMEDNDKVYGFNMFILDDARSFPSLWHQTQSFLEAHPEYIHANASVGYLVDEDQGMSYNNCQFFSNFEIGSLKFFQGKANEAYFEWLDRAGGFYYERYGDAPIHTLSVAMFAGRQQVHFFRDIGYQHDAARHCPSPEAVAASTPKGAQLKEQNRKTDKKKKKKSDTEDTREPICNCEPTELDENFYKLVPMESPQKKPADSCIRMFLGGKYLEKQEGWDQETERILGGDGYSGYVHDL